MNNSLPCKSWNRIPLATCRLQFNSAFTLRDAAPYISFLNKLGISDIYSSPLFLAAPGSTHGYDACDFRQLNPSIGAINEFGAFIRSLKNYSMGLLLDIVPNHMAASLTNPWWYDVLKYGQDSRYSKFFDIDWNRRDFPGKVLLPVLGEHYAKVLNNGELKLKRKDQDYFLVYYDSEFPINPATYPSTEQLSIDELDDLIARQNYRLAYWRVASEEINYRRFFDISGLVSIRIEDSQVFEETHKLLFEWIREGYVTGLRIDHPDGLRDPKQYFERLQSNLQNGSTCFYTVIEKILSDSEKLPDSWPVAGTTGYDFLNVLNGVFVVQGNETAFSNIYHEFLSQAAQSIEQTSEPTPGINPIDDGSPSLLLDYEPCVKTAKRQILQNSLASEVNHLALRLKQVASENREGIDLTFSSLKNALTAALISFPVYRSYFSYSGGGKDINEEPLTPTEIDYINVACDLALNELPEQDRPALEFLRKILLRQPFPNPAKKFVEDSAEFVVRFQQLSGPATAKGLEDTTFYRYTRFVSLNEVGGNPGKFGVSREEFHQFNRHTQEHWPHTLLATATHDTKRGEDVRARLNVLSEIPDVWKQTVFHWHKLNQKHKAQIGSHHSPSNNDEYLLYQTLVGTWPLDLAEPDTAYIERIKAYMQKAMREAKLHTTWIDVNTACENGVMEFIDAILNSKAFLDSFREFLSQIAPFGIYNSLAQLLLKLGAPGVPDFYQGNEFWDFHLVDPDNRQPVAAASRVKKFQNLLSDKQTQPLPNLLSRLLEHPEDEAIKLFTMWRVLEFRKEHGPLFTFGDYHPISPLGPASHNLVAFRRTHGSSQIIVAAPCFLATLAPTPGEALRHANFEQTRLPIPAGTWRNIYTEETISCDGKLNCAAAFRSFPLLFLAQT